MIAVLASTDLQLLSIGSLVVLCGFILFAGSIYLLLAALLGKKMAYLLEASCFFAFLMILSSLWTWGFYSQGPETPTNQGPRGTEANWQPLDGGLQASGEEYPVALKYPNAPWEAPNDATAVSKEPMETAVKQFMADQANAEAGIEVQTEIPVAAGGRGPAEYPDGKVPFTPDQFTVQDVRFATEGDKSLGAARAFYTGGGPEVTVVAVHDPGNVWIYSWVFLIVSVIGFAVHVPFLDREEKKRKEILTSEPASWRGKGGS